MTQIAVPQQYSKLIAVERQTVTPFWTPEQGLAVQVLAGEDLVRGNIVTPLQGGLDGAVYKVPISGNNLDTPCAIVYADAYVGDLVWIVVTGLAYVLPVSTVTPTLGYYGYSGTTEAGRAASSATAPATVRRAFCQFLATGSGAGVLTLALLRTY